MKKIVLFILIMVAISGCHLGEYKLKRLPNRQLSFKELPVKVQQCLSEHPKCKDDSNLVFVDLADSVYYRTESILDAFVSAWLDHIKLIDKKNGFTYYINLPDVGPGMYIIFKNKVYTPDLYNLLCSGDIFEAKYTEYQLKLRNN